MQLMSKRAVKQNEKKILRRRNLFLASLDFFFFFWAPVSVSRYHGEKDTVFKNPSEEYNANYEGKFAVAMAVRV